MNEPNICGSGKQIVRKGRERAMHECGKPAGHEGGHKCKGCAHAWAPDFVHTGRNRQPGCSCPACTLPIEASR